MVIVFHWIPQAHHFVLPLGSWGVELFFVLSGFLITKILLEDRLIADKSKTSKLTVIKNFVIRRSLRIFPIYYITLFVVLFFDRADITGLGKNWEYFFGYATNLLYFKTQQFNYPMAHLWSLAVEEQFYLIWPWFILFLPFRFILKFLWIAVIFGIGARIVLSFIFLNSTQVTVDVLTPCCFDSFSIGGLFAYYVVHQKNSTDKIISFLNKAGLVSFVIMIFLLITRNNTFSFLHRTLDSIFFLAVIANAFKGLKGFAGIILNNNIMLYIGKISYGVYIYHLITPWLTKVIFTALLKYETLNIGSHFYFSLEDSGKLFIDLCILILTAVASWSLIEKPINKYKYIFK